MGSSTSSNSASTTWSSAAPGGPPTTAPACPLSIEDALRAAAKTGRAAAVGRIQIVRNGNEETDETGLTGRIECGVHDRRAVKVRIAGGDFRPYGAI